jgi:hypothetical protein
MVDQSEYISVEADCFLGGAVPRVRGKIQVQAFCYLPHSLKRKEKEIPLFQGIIILRYVTLRTDGRTWQKIALQGGCHNLKYLKVA